MTDVALAIAGVTVFALTTWESLVFGYEVFQHIWETDQADGAASARPPSDDPAISLPVADATDGDASRPSELVHPAAPTA